MNMGPVGVDVRTPLTRAIELHDAIRLSCRELQGNEEIRAAYDAAKTLVSAGEIQKAATIINAGLDYGGGRFALRTGVITNVEMAKLISACLDADTDQSHPKLTRLDRARLQYERGNCLEFSNPDQALQDRIDAVAGFRAAGVFDLAASTGRKLALRHVYLCEGGGGRSELDRAKEYIDQAIEDAHLIRSSSRAPDWNEHVGVPMTALFIEFLQHGPDGAPENIETPFHMRIMNVPIMHESRIGQAARAMPESVSQDDRNRFQAYNRFCAEPLAFMAMMVAAELHMRPNPDLHQLALTFISQVEADNVLLKRSGYDTAIVEFCKILLEPSKIKAGRPGSNAELLGRTRALFVSCNAQHFLPRVDLLISACERM